MADPTLADLKPGDRVQVFDINGSRMGQPKCGWDGTVVKVGRKLIYVTYPRARCRTDGDAFRLDTGRRNDNVAHQRIQTVEQAAKNQRRSVAVNHLRENGLDLNRRRDLATDTLEALVAVLGQENSDH